MHMVQTHVFPLGSHFRSSVSSVEALLFRMDNGQSATNISTRVVNSSSSAPKHAEKMTEVKKVVMVFGISQGPSVV